MRITVVGATGGIGQEIVEQAVGRGHRVTAVSRNPASFSEGVSVVQAGLNDRAGLKAAVTGADAVLSALGPRSRAAVGIASEGTQAVIGAMQAAGAGRLLVVSAAPVSTVGTSARNDPGNDLLARYVLYPVIGRILRPHYEDLARMEESLRSSGLQWTSVRPPRLTNGPRTGKYRTAADRNVLGGRSISRADVAHLMLGLLERPETAGHAVSCGY